MAKKEGILGPNRSLCDVQEITCLNKIFRWVKDDSGEAIEIEADPRQVEIICAKMKLVKTSKAVVTPGVKLPRRTSARTCTATSRRRSAR